MLSAITFHRVLQILHKINLPGFTVLTLTNFNFNDYTQMNISVHTDVGSN